MQHRPARQHEAELLDQHVQLLTLQVQLIRQQCAVLMSLQLKIDKVDHMIEVSGRNALFSVRVHAASHRLSVQSRVIGASAERNAGWHAFGHHPVLLLLLPHG